MPEEIYTAFENHWLKSSAPLKILDLNETHLDGNVSEVICRANVEWKGKKYSIEAEGNGPLDAFALALKQTPAPLFNITSFHEHSVGKGSDTNAMAYVKITADGGKTAWGAGKSSNVGRAGIAAVVSAINDL